MVTHGPITLVTKLTASQLPDVCVRGLQLITEARLSPVKVSHVWFRSAQLTHSLMGEKQMLVALSRLAMEWLVTQ